ncbi:RNA-directed DNA polymerase, eukaryota, reverse transcriptase zinc-binding domain protein [Tanacetum coccineum]
MINLIMTCVTTPSFFVCVNGASHGYFRGGRGLRQGDPISPYLFTIVMEVFNLTLKQFIRDILCHGDVKSAKVVRDALNNFCSMSGLRPNMGKRIVFFGNLKDHVKKEILEVLPFSVGKLHVSYLGVPLVSKQLGFNNCRLQLIASVLSAIHVYWASVFMLPKTVINDIDKIMKGFLWNYGELKNGTAKIRLKGQSIWKVGIDPNTSAGWKQILSLRDKIKSHIVKKIGDGISSFTWFDKWWEKGVLSDILSADDIKRANLDLKIKVCDMIEDDKWKWPRDCRRLTTQDRLLKWYPGKEAVCHLCKTCLDSHNHLFFDCHYSKKIWDEVMRLIPQSQNTHVWEEIIDQAAKWPKNRSVMSIIKRISLAVSVYCIWNERNKRLFTKEVKDWEIVLKVIIYTIRFKLLSVKVKSPKQVKSIEEIWRIKFNTQSNEEIILEE